MGEVFRNEERPDLTKEITGQQFSKSISLRLSGYKNADPSVKQQKSLTPFFLRQMFHRAATPFEIALSQLTTLALFFDCRSCEHITAASERKLNH